MAYFLRSRRLGWRSWRADDLPAATALWGDPLVTRFIHAQGVMDESEIAARLAAEMASEREHGLQYWPLFLLEGDPCVGCCGLRPYAQEPGVLELGFHIVSRYWRQGYALEAATTVIDHAFSTLAASALFAGHHPRNRASAQLLARLGFRYTHDEYYPPTGLEHPSYRLKQRARRREPASSRPPEPV